MKKALLTKFIVTLILSIFIVTLIANNFYIMNAASRAKIAIMGVENKAKYAENGIDASGLVGVISKLLGLLRIASGLIAILMIAITGFNYIVGTPEVKDEMKKKMLPIIIGLMIVFGATSVATFIISAVNDIGKY